MIQTIVRMVEDRLSKAAGSSASQSEFRTMES